MGDLLLVILIYPAVVVGWAVMAAVAAFIRSARRTDL